MTSGEIISASIAGIALIVACLARLDSKKSADAAQKSADAAHRANDLLARQLDMAADDRKRQIQKDQIESQPQISWDYGSAGAQSVTHRMKNFGGPMAKIAVSCESGFRATVSPDDVIAQGTEADVQFICSVQPQPNLFRFDIEFDDKFGERKRLSFTACRNSNGTWELPKAA